MTSYADQLAQLQLAITAIETGAQEYTIADRTLRRGDLQAMYDERKYLAGMTAREAVGGGIRVRRIIKNS
jgi:hypothetical protein